jgi:predicted carbohydrate-binding protein with CBM5 and CBM33 domain
MDARVLLLGLVCILGSLVAVHGHGYMLQPAARNWVAHKQQRFWNEASGKATRMAQVRTRSSCRRHHYI